MKQSKSLAWLILLFSVTLLAAGCSGKTKLKGELGIKGAPDWVNEGTNIINDKKGRLFHGVGSAPPMGDDSLQISTADDRARAEVARVLSSYMDVVSNDYLASTNTGSGSEAEQAVTRQIKALTKVNLTGAKIIRRWKDKRTGNVYSITELDMKHVRKTMQGVQDMNEDLRRYMTTHAENIFDKVAAKGVN